jgi:hypothetical protein
LKLETSTYWKLEEVGRESARSQKETEISVTGPGKIVPTFHSELIEI